MRRFLSRRPIGSCLRLSRAGLKDVSYYRLAGVDHCPYSLIRVATMRPVWMSFLADAGEQRSGACESLNAAGGTAERCYNGGFGGGMSARIFSRARKIHAAARGGGSAVRSSERKRLRISRRCGRGTGGPGRRRRGGWTTRCGRFLARLKAASSRRPRRLARHSRWRGPRILPSPTTCNGFGGGQLEPNGVEAVLEERFAQHARIAGSQAG